MNRLELAWRLLRCFGPRIVLLRGQTWLRNRTGHTRRVYAPRDWDSLDLGFLPPNCSEAQAARVFDAFRAAPPPLFFDLGLPPAAGMHLLAEGRGSEAPQSPLPHGRGSEMRQSPVTGACASEGALSLSERVALIGQGRCVYSFRTPSPVPVEWYANPITGGRCDPSKPWFELRDFAAGQGDMRSLWEPGRAAWAIDLLRFAARGGADCGDGPPGLTGDSPSDSEVRRYEVRRDEVRHDEAWHGEAPVTAFGEFAPAKVFWLWVESFLDASPPFRGPQWKCGQEASVRLIALSLGFWGFARDAATTPLRFLRFARLVWATGYRVAHHIDYAISQKNNHALSEACGLMLAAHLFPAFRESAAWAATGRRVMERELLRQIYPDGSYVQQSLNYHRVMLNIACFAIRLAEIGGRPLDRAVYERVGVAGEFLYELLDEQTGRGPNYGNNDGALVLPLTDCDFTDFRPAVQTALRLTRGASAYPPGPWDEESTWLGIWPNRDREGAGAVRRVVPSPHTRAFDAGGYYTLRTDDAFAMVRCHTFRDRPAHYDPLHVDFWWRGLNLLRDAGTFLYYVPGRPDIELYFKGIAAHNTPQLGGREPLEAVSRFLWLPWPRGRLIRFEPNGDRDGGVFEGEHFDYQRSLRATVRRRVTLRTLPNERRASEAGHGEHPTAGGVRLELRDVVTCGGPQKLVLRLHLLDVPVEFSRDDQQASLTLQTPRGRVAIESRCVSGALRRAEVLRGVDADGRFVGWESRYYSHRAPLPVLEIEMDFDRTAELATSFVCE